MEILKYLWSLAPLWGPLVVVAAIVYAVLRARRSRSASTPAEAPAPDAEPDVLDSSHIGFAPLVGVLEPPNYDRGVVAGGDADQK